MTILIGMLVLGLAMADQPDPFRPDERDAPADSVDFRVDEHRWTHRLLVVFAPSRDDASFEQQMIRFTDVQEGLAERDLLLITVVDDGLGQVGGEPLTANAEQRLRDRYEVASPAFRVVLVGKDGTEKRRDEEPVTARSIFDTIDAMPMRQREMREDGGGTR